MSPRPNRHTLAWLRECPDCGYFSHLPRLRPGTDARCPRCNGVLRRERANPLDKALACSIGGILFYILAVTAPFIEVRLSGQYRFSTLFSGPESLESQGLPLLALVVLLFTMVAPFLKLAITLCVLLGLRAPEPPRWLPVPFRWLERLGPWSMIEVYLLGVFVAYTRLTALAQVDIETAAYALAGLMLFMVSADAALDPEAVWEEMERKGVVVEHRAAAERAGTEAMDGDMRKLIGCHVCHRVNHVTSGPNCTRCNTRLHRRKPNSLVRTWALLGAAAILYIPANTFSVMNITRLGRTAPHTILGGARELLDAGMWPLALLVFFASITVPVLKLVGLVTMLVSTRRGTAWRLYDRTRLYRLVDFIGRWSMIDVFMISILVALVHFGQLANITSDIGAVAFASVVVLTMFAAEGFDPRLMWDAAEANARRTTCPLEQADQAGDNTP